MSPTTHTPAIRRSLGARLVLATLGFCVAFTVLTVAVRTWSAWQDALAAMNSELMLVEKVYRQTLTKAIWEMDRDSLHAHVDGVAQVAAVGWIEVRMSSINRPPEIIERSARGWQESSLAPVRHLELVHEPFAGGGEKVGELTLAGDERVLWVRLRGEVKAIVVTQLLQSLLLAGLIMLLFDRSVTVHVKRIAGHLSQMTPARLDVPLDLGRSAQRRDELTLLEAGVNELQAKLSHHLAQLQSYETELAGHRDRLAALVQTRTGELESLTQVQQLVLTLSNRLIHAPYETFDECMGDCLSEIAQRLGASLALWLFPEPNNATYRVFLEWQASVPTSERLQNLPAPDGACLPVALEREEILIFSSRAELEQTLSPLEARSFSDLPVEACALARLNSGDDRFGFLFIGKPVWCSGWSAQDRALLAMTAQMLLHSARHKAHLLEIIAAQEALQRANRQLEDLSRHDALTGLFNRRHFDDIKEDEFRRAQRSGLPLSLLICDIDLFKDYNDHYGHASGDQCLRAVAGAMRESITRGGDALARIGGEEFAVLLPATTQTAALKVAERIRLSVSALRIAHADSRVEPHVTISIGVAQTDFESTESFDALFEEADKALYRAKENGRNRVELSPAPAHQPVS